MVRKTKTVGLTKEGGCGTDPCDGSQRYEPDGKRTEVVRRRGQQPCACVHNPSSVLVALISLPLSAGGNNEQTNQELQDAVCGPVRAPGRVHTNSQRVPGWLRVVVR